MGGMCVCVCVGGGGGGHIPQREAVGVGRRIVGVGQQFPETMNPIYSLKTVSIAPPVHKAF